MKIWKDEEDWRQTAHHLVDRMPAEFLCATIEALNSIADTASFAMKLPASQVKKIDVVETSVLTDKEYREWAEDCRADFMGH